jgi:SPP1 gp7 family putative phage head morphogenesis protein
VIRYPAAAEAELATKLTAHLQVIRRVLLQRMGELAARPGVSSADIASALAVTQAALEHILVPPTAGLLQTAALVDRLTTRAMARALAASMGKGLAQDARMQPRQLEVLRARWAAEVLQRQRRIEADLFERLKREARTREPAEIVTLVREETKKAESFLRLAAADEVGALQAEITQARAEALGVQHYRWASEDDERVRPLHRKLHGTIRRWDQPHPTEGHPGQARGCRCTAQPHVEALPRPKASESRRPKPVRGPQPVPAAVPAVPAVPMRDPGRLAGATPPGGSGAPPPPPSSPPPPPAPPAPRSPSYDLSKVKRLSLSPPAEERAARLRAIFGREVTDSEVLSWVGVTQADLDEAKGISLVVHGGEVNVTVSTPKFKATRLYKRSAVSGQLLAEHESLEVLQPGQGLGAQIFARQVDALRASGFGRIDTLAAGHYGDDTYNGYWTWARFGFSGRLPQRLSSKLPPELASAQTVSDLMMTPDGREWWRLHGQSLDMSFDLDPSSRSSEHLEIYLASKGIRRDAEEIDLDEEDGKLLDAAWDELARRERARREVAERQRREESAA